jgi:prepilin-type N-terminal cleavage/methylation domain-containing protein
LKEFANKNHMKKGFTLIELLVVIAIIGILSSVVLASLNTARAKGADAAIKSNLANARAQAELFYNDNTNSYFDVCGVASAGTTKSINSSLVQARATGGFTPALNVTTANAGTGETTTCHATAAAWAAESPLKASTAAVPSMYCVDSQGNSKVTTAALAASAVVCP